MPKTSQAEQYSHRASKQYHEGFKMLERLPIRSGQTILDIGAGTGKLTYELAKRVGSTGRVIALEPDKERIEIAMTKQPTELNNITWINRNLNEIYDKYNFGSFDIVYSNYVFHWINDTNEAIQFAHKILKPGAPFAFCAVFTLPKLILRLNAHIGNVKKINFISQNDWIRIMNYAGFIIHDHLIFPVDDYDFSNLEELLDWWQATTHGTFDKEKLPENAFNQLKQEYPGEIILPQTETTFRVYAIKSSEKAVLFHPHW